MKRCDLCGGEYDGPIVICPLDRRPLTEVADPRVGTMIAGFHLLAPIGEGSLARVYRARRIGCGPHDASLAALKLLTPNVARSPILRERFVREGRAASRLDHPNIARVISCGEEQGTAFLAMELLEGETLDRTLTRGPLALSHAIDVACRLAAALSCAHAEGIVHRDLKPANVFATRDGAIKLLDFGLAKVRGEARLTTTGALCGTPTSMAPEQIDGRPITPAADLYALGCLLFHMIAGRPPFVGVVSAVLAAHERDAPPPLDAPANIRTLVERLLAKAPADRPESAAAVEQALA